MLWAFLAISTIAVAFLLDEPVARLLEFRTPGPGKTLAIWVSKLGEGWAVALAGLTVALWCFGRGKAHEAHQSLFVIGTSLVTGLAATLLRVLLGRTRPDAMVEQGFYGIWHDGEWILGKYAFSSFPSGHVATVISLATAVWLLNRRLGVFISLYAIAVCWSRIAARCHHFSDVIAAAAFGMAGAYYAVEFVLPRLDTMRENLRLRIWGNRGLARQR